MRMMSVVSLRPALACASCVHAVTHGRVRGQTDSHFTHKAENEGKTPFWRHPSSEEEGTVTSSCVGRHGGASGDAEAWL